MTASLPTAVTRPPSSLRAALAATVVAVLVFASLRAVAVAQIHRYLERFNIDDSQFDKLLGVEVQEEVFRDPALLPVYGSSELTEPQLNRADHFFQTRPTGFGAYLIGYPSENSLMVATKLAALDPAVVKGKKAVVFLSPVWFVERQLDHDGFRVNFSMLHGTILAFEHSLSPSLKAGIASRLLDYPTTVGENPLLSAALRCMRAQSAVGDSVLGLMQPLGRASNAARRVMDCLESGWWGWRNRLAPPAVQLPVSAPVDWKASYQDAESICAHAPTPTAYGTGPRNYYDDENLDFFQDPQHPENSPDQNFAWLCANSKEWTDLDLLLRTARELQVQLLIVWQPLNRNYSMLQGLTEKSQTLFERRMNVATANYDVATATYLDSGDDTHFFCDCAHPSAKAWIAYDYALDTFFHRGTPPDHGYQKSAGGTRSQCP